MITDIDFDFRRYRFFNRAASGNFINESTIRRCDSSHRYSSLAASRTRSGMDQVTGLRYPLGGWVSKVY